MRGSNNQIWVTSAVTDDQVEGCLMVYRSLKRAMTNRPVGVIASTKLSPKLKTVLTATFDYYFVIEEDGNTTGLKMNEFAKLSTFSLLRAFEKCVYLDSNMMVVQNCDEIFEKYGNFKGFVCPENMDMSVFLGKPSMALYGLLTKGLVTKNGYTFEKYLQIWCDSQNENEVFIDEKYNQSIGKGTFLSTQQEISIVKFCKDPMTLGSHVEKLGILEMALINQWSTIYESEIKPLLEQPTNISSVGNYLTESATCKEPIAIVGMSCRYPSANNLEQFWNILFSGQDGTGTAPPYRWLREQTISNPVDCKNTNAGFLHTPIDEFDSKFFGISPKEMFLLDPQTRLLHELVWEALEDGAINPEILRGTNGGVFMGSWTNDYKDILNHTGNTDFFRCYMGNSIGAAAARISFMLGMTGPSIATESGCSSAMVAVHLACQSLQRGETNMALACGVNLLLHPFNKDVMPMVLSPDGHCKTFDANADGFARAEGCGVLVLKKMSDAVKDGDRIWGLIRGSGISQEGVSKSMGTPTVQCESIAMQQALQDAQIEPELVSYVEAHGTGTPVGDPMEVAAIAKAYHSKYRKDPLIIGSVKTNVGHTESCSGITGIMKVVLSMQHELIPAHLNLKTLNPAINLDAVPAKIPMEATPWKKVYGKPRYAGVSSFGITGTDAHVIIQEAPEKIDSGKIVLPEFSRPMHILKISAKTEDALNSLLEMYQGHLETSLDPIGDIAYTANVGRMNFDYRAAIVAKSGEDAVKILQRKDATIGEVTDKPGKICFLFTGQGSQYPGMAKQLYKSSPVFRVHFDYCQNLLENKYQISIKDILWGESKSNDISRTIYSQTSIFCVEYALLKLWESWGVKPDFALGHSLGEFAAAVCAGIVNVEDAIKLVAERSRLIDQLPRGKMLVIKADKSSVNEAMNKFARGDSNLLLDYAAINSSQQTVVAGDSDVIMKFSQHCATIGLKCIVLDATHAFHSRHMDPMLNEYKNVAETVEQSNENNCEFISGMRGDVVQASEVNALYWMDHTREKVEFMKASKKAVSLGCQIFIEIGPQPVLSALTMMNNDGNFLCVPSLKRNEDEWTTLLNTVAKLWVKGISFDWNGFDQFYSRKKISLPHYPFSGKKYWPDMNAVTGASIHPLIGSVISNASSTKLFQSGFSLSSLDYVKDHVIGPHAIIPGASYIEMCLAAGLATIEGSTESLGKPSRPMKVENMTIEAPFGMTESKTYNVQTVVDYNLCNDQDWNDMSVKIFHKVDNSSASSQSKWLRHAQATFSPLPTAADIQITVDLAQFQDLMSQPPDEPGRLEFYTNLNSLGLKFGLMFQSLEKLWKDDTSANYAAKVKVPAEENQNTCIIHPVVIDAMIQAAMLMKNRETTKLMVPFKIGKFVWLSSPRADDGDLFVYTYEEFGDKTATALLVDSQQTVLAMITQVELISTTVKAIEAVLEQQTVSMAGLWEEVWKPKMGPMQYNLDMEICGGPYCSEELKQSLASEYNDTSPVITNTFDKLGSLVYYNMLRSLYEIGWKPEQDEIFDENELFAELQIEAEFRRYFGYFFDVFQDEGWLERVGNTTWKTTRVPPSLEFLQERISSPELSTELASVFHSTLLVAKFGKSLANILTGKLQALPILFPDETCDWPSVGHYYKESGTYWGIETLAIAVINNWMEHAKNVGKGEKQVCRILEVGGGTGATTKLMVPAFQKYGIEFEYTFTDISAAFFPPIEKYFENLDGNHTCQKLNIEEDPLSQGFTPGYFDYICATDVIHATRNIHESLTNIWQLLKPFGKFDMVEQTRTNRLITYLFGALEGFWRFEDLDVRPRHCTMDVETWISSFESANFNVVHHFPSLHNYHNHFVVQKSAAGPPKINATNKTWLIFHTQEEPLSQYLLDKMAQTGRQVVAVTSGDSCDFTGDHWIVRPQHEEDFKSLVNTIKSSNGTIEGVIYAWSLNQNNTQQGQILQPYLYLTKSLQKLHKKGTLKLVALTKGLVPVADNDTSIPHTSTLLGFTRSLKNESFEIMCRCVDISTEPLTQKGLEEIFLEMWNTEKSTIVAYNSGTRYIPKFVSLKPIFNDLKIPQGTDRFQLILPETKSINDLQFGPGDLLTLGNNHVEVAVKASALNFKDILNILKPTEEFKNSNAVGFDFAGVVKTIGSGVTRWKVGDAVFGVNVHGSALPSHVAMNEDDLQPVPNDITLCDAATLPAVVATAYYCLMEVAKIKSSDTVLLHTASGGVGLAAIQLCQHVGCTIIATAGSKRKQSYLRSLGIQHIFHSRNTKYEHDILKVTNGRGVDVVLNSLTSEGFKEATLKACAKYARFVEMSKLSIWTPEEMTEFRADVDYTIVDLSAMESKDWKRLMGKLQELVESKIIRPYPYVRFDAVNIRSALNYMQKAKHIGKIVCVMPEIRNEDGNVKVHMPIFSDRSTYLITGGLGGIGFEVCKWMVGKGAKHVILAGRSLPSDKMKNEIKQLNSAGANVIPVQLDVSNFDECKHLIQSQIPSMGLPQLRGVMHAAGTLSDGLIANQTWDKLSSTFKTKIAGTLNLHELTKSINMEHFVMFSSMAALFGSPGQCNHSAGNQFEDSLVNYRNSIGLSATSINWGQWGEVGIAAEIDLPGLKAISNLQGTNALEYVLRTQRQQTCVINMESFVLLGKLMPQISNYLDERILQSSNSSSSTVIKSEEFWQQYDSTSVISEKIDLVKQFLKLVLRKILKLDDSDVVNDDANFQEMGVDSLMFVEIKNAIQALLGDRITVNANTLRDCTNINQLSSVLVKLIEGDDVAKLPTTDEVVELLREDCTLPEHIKTHPGQCPVNVENISTVLITGCTGAFGPYMLRTLTNMSQVTRVICLMRSHPNHSAKNRLINKLKQLNILNQTNMTKVECVIGNVAQPRLGMEPQIWNSLISSVDAVVHCAACVQHTKIYRKSDSNDEMRQVNIEGLRNLLEFCVSDKLKHVLHSSAMAVVASVDEDGRVSEDWAQLNAYDGATHLAYPNTKFAGEYLMKQAVERGIPVKSFRYPIMMGDSKSGQFTLEHNHAMLRYIFIMKNGNMPSAPFPMVLLPVDVCADVSLKLFFNPEVPTSEIFNVTLPNPQMDQDFVEVAEKFGISVKFVEYEEFAQSIQQSEDTTTLEMFKEIYQEDAMDVLNRSVVLKHWVEGAHQDFWRSRKLDKYYPNCFEGIGSTMDFVHKDLLYAKNQGWFKQFGL